MQTTEKTVTSGTSSTPSHSGHKHHHAPHGSGTPGLYADRPLLVYRELTRACELVCRHCRAEAQATSDPNELTTEENLRLLKQLTRFGNPLPRIVMTGGDPLKRADLFDLITAAREMGFLVAITPSGTYALTAPVVKRLKDVGIETIAVSIDGSTAQRHDGIRGVPGSFDVTVKAAHYVRAMKVPLQINTLVCAETIDDLPAMALLLEKLGAERWSLFFLISVGRGQALKPITPEQCEQLMHSLGELTRYASFDIKTTEAPHYRRVSLQRRAARRREGHDAQIPASVQRGFGIRDGNGIMFISHVGEIYPSGFLPLMTGDVRKDDPVMVYRDHPVFRSLRDANQLKGRCGYCEFRWVCGGSRARAYAATGDPLETDPLCPYEPQREASPSLVGN